MKKFIILTASMLTLSNIAPLNFVAAQEAGSNIEIIAVSQEQKSELQTALDEAVEIYRSQHPEAIVTDVDIHLHQETSQFIVRIIGHSGNEAHQLIRYNGENFFANQPHDDDDDAPINFEELVPLEQITQSAIDYVQSDRIVNWTLDSEDGDDDDDRLEWELTFIDNNREIEVEVDALTGEVVDRDDDDLDDSDFYDDDRDDDDDRQYYRQFYSDYSGTRSTVYEDNNWYRRDWDDDWDDDDWDDDDWDDYYDDLDDYYDDWDDDDWDDWDDDDWDDWDDDWDDDDWDDWDDDDWDDDWDDDDWDDWDDDDWDDDWDDDDWDD